MLSCVTTIIAGALVAGALAACSRTTFDARPAAGNDDVVRSMPASWSTAATRIAPPATTDSATSAHVKTWAYWGQPAEPAGVTAGFVAANVTFLEADAPHVTQFHAAGGAYGVAYTDPSRVIPSRHEPLWNVPESGWFHDSSGQRIYYVYPGYGTQNMLNPEQQVTRAAYAALTKQIAASAPYAYVEADNTYFDLVGAFYQFNAPGVEAGSQAAYDDGIAALLEGSAVSPLVNGLSNEDGGLNKVSGTTMFLAHAAGGINNEGCLQATYVKSLPQWEFDENTLLYTSTQHKWSICWPQSAQTADAHQERSYFLGSWWLTYDPTYSVAFPQFASHSGLFIFPEYAIVPLDPKQTAVSSVTELQQPGGPFVREFASCSQGGIAIGACAAFVNPSGSTLPLPARASAYRRMLSLDANNLFDGGRAAWVTNSATALRAQSAVIVSDLTTATPAPTPPPSGTSITVFGTIASFSSTTPLLQSSCGYESVYYDASTPIVGNGYRIAAGTNVRVAGTGSCSTSVQAAEITLTGIGLTIAGQILSLTSSGYVIATTGSCGNVPIDVQSSTVYQGPQPAAGRNIIVTGTGSCASGVSASSVTTE